MLSKPKTRPALHCSKQSSLANSAKSLPCISSARVPAPSGCSAARVPPLRRWKSQNVVQGVPHSQSLRWCPSLLEQSGPDGGVPEILKVFNRGIGPKTLVKHALGPTAPACKDLLDVDALSKLRPILQRDCVRQHRDSAGSQGASLAGKPTLHCVCGRWHLAQGAGFDERNSQGFCGIQVDRPSVGSDFSN